MEMEAQLMKVEPQAVKVKSQAIQVEPQDVEVVFRRFYSDIQDCIAQPGGVAAVLYSEDIVSEEVLDKAELLAKPVAERNTAIMRAIRVAIKADHKRVWVLIAALEKYSESAPVAKNMRRALEIHRLAGK